MIVPGVNGELLDAVKSIEHVVLNHEFEVIVIAMSHAFMEQWPFHGRITIASNHDGLIRSSNHINVETAMIIGHGH